MSELLNKLRAYAAEKAGEAGAEAIDEQGAQALDELFAAARTYVEANVDGDWRRAGHAALDALEDVKPQALRLGKHGLALAVGMIDAGEEVEAQRFYMTHVATQAERDAWIDARGDAAVDAAAERQASWAAFKDGVLEALAQGGQVLGSILLHALGVS